MDNFIKEVKLFMNCSLILYLLFFLLQSLGSKAISEAKFKQQLRLQTEVHMDHLKDAADMAEKEVNRRVRLEYTEKAEIEKLKYQEQVSGMTAVMHAINDALKGG